MRLDGQRGGKWVVMLLSEIRRKDADHILFVYINNQCLQQLKMDTLAISYLKKREISTPDSGPSIHWRGIV